MESTIRNRSWPSVSCAPTPSSDRPTLPMKRTPESGIAWHRRQFESRLTTTALPRAASPGAGTSRSRIASPATRYGGTASGAEVAQPVTPAITAIQPTKRTLGRWSPCLDDPEAVVLERQGAHRLSGRGEDGVQDRGRNHADGRLSHSAPEVVGRRDDGLDLGQLGEPRDRVGVVVQLHRAPVLHRNFA